MNKDMAKSASATTEPKAPEFVCYVERTTPQGQVERADKSDDPIWGSWMEKNYQVSAVVKRNGEVFQNKQTPANMGLLLQQTVEDGRYWEKIKKKAEDTVRVSRARYSR